MIKPVKLFSLFIIALFLLSIVSTHPVQAVGGSSQFGYTYTPIAYNWQEISAPENAVLDNTDNGYTSAITLPFTLQYFEKAVTKLYISANGLISFAAIEGSNSVGRPIPLDEKPNSLVAPFWDDLVVGSDYGNGKVYAKTLGAVGSRNYIVEWENVSRSGSSDKLTFQVVFVEGTNSIEFVYKTVSGTLTEVVIGIEDSDGVDGIEISNHGSTVLSPPGLISGLALRFLHPGNGFRLKVLPPYQSGFLTANSLMAPVTAWNVSSMGYSDDSYNISFDRVSGAPDWTVTFLNQAGQVISNTGAVPSGGSKTFYVRLTAPPGAPRGAYLLINLTLTSANSSLKSFTVQIQGAIGAPVVQAFSDYGTGLRLQAINSRSVHSRLVTNYYDTIASLAIAPAQKEYRYFAVWAVASGLSYNLKYSMLDLTSSGASPISALAAGNPDYTLDYSPAIAVAPNGVAGVVFIRSVNNPAGDDQKKNVYFARIDGNGAPLGTPINITNNTLYGVSTSPDVPFFSLPSISVTQDNRFIIAWTKSELISSLVHQDIGAAAYDTAGGVVSASHYLTASGTTINYLNPNLTRISTSGRVYMSYIASEPGNLTDPLRLMGVVLDNTAQKFGSDAILATVNANSSQMDTTILWGGNLLAAWIDRTTLTPVYGVWTTSGTVVKSPTALSAPDKRRMNQVSVAYDQYGNGVITWGNQEKSRLYYAVVDGSGTLVTRPMIQFNAGGVFPLVHMGSGVSSSAFVNDPLTFWYRMPLVSKH